jgi:hypothetical protein
VIWPALIVLAETAPAAPPDASTFAWASGGAVGGALVLSQLLRPLVDAMTLRMRGSSREAEAEAKHRTRTLIESQAERIAELVRAQERIADALDRLAQRLDDLRDEIRRIDR